MILCSLPIDWRVWSSSMLSPFSHLRQEPACICMISSHWCTLSFLCIASVNMQDVSVETPQGSTYEGKRFDGKVHVHVVDEPIPPPPPSTIFAIFILPYIYWMTAAVWCVHHESWGGPRTSSDVRLQGCHPWKDTHTDQWGHWWTRGIIILCMTLRPARDSS